MLILQALVVWLIAAVALCCCVMQAMKGRTLATLY